MGYLLATKTWAIIYLLARHGLFTCYQNMGHYPRAATPTVRRTYCAAGAEHGVLEEVVDAAVVRLLGGEHGLRGAHVQHRRGGRPVPVSIGRAATQTTRVTARNTTTRVTARYVAWPLGTRLVCVRVIVGLS